ncbi:hypothetical protein Goshw_008079 [Gossypium schwendimanii]|uniref:Uncharacterized protein n=1 Tax=Gossypium schwendimanii TaxID=34291 RepID=A0A7J9LUG0_GOSSC|nr:hypothetical protein [Gossypium schwendimanii]
MSAVAGIGKIRFRDTCAEAGRFSKIGDLLPNQDKTACEKLLGVRTDVGPQEVKGDRSKSVFGCEDGCWPSGSEGRPK